MMNDNKYLYFYEVDKNSIRVIDGDTIECTVDLGFKIYHRVKIRLYGIDVYEIYGRASKKEKELGKKAKQFVINLFNKSKKIYVKTYKDKKGKYGRYLGDFILITSNNESVSLVEELKNNNYNKKIKVFVN